ncbi:MAG: hypothetical protein RIS34_2346 [Pseudomonadota bacterium]|jgi:lysophospholipase L1-like esterase
MKTLLCFGDSNTWGSIPMADRDDIRRFGSAQRWPGVLQRQLGAEWQVIEEGLPGRTMARDDPVEGADRNALRYLQPCLQSHRPLTTVAFMLGTNDLKARFGASAEQIAEGLHTLIDLTYQNTAPGLPSPRILIICPPSIVEVGWLGDMFAGGAAKSQQLALHYRRVATQRGVAFLDAGGYISASTIDGIHLDELAHAQLGAAVAQALI